MFSVHTTPEKFENVTITGHFGFVFEENLHDHRDAVIVFGKLLFSKSSAPKRKAGHRRFQMAVDKTRNMEHPGTSNNYDNYKKNM